MRRPALPFVHRSFGSVALFASSALVALSLLTACKPVGPNYNRPGYQAPVA
jgi:hypothetical protein